MTPSNIALNFNNIQYNINNITNDIQDWFSSVLDRSGDGNQLHEFSSLPSLRQISLHISFQELENGTNNFNEANRLGSGTFGNVYKGKLRDGSFVAIKLINQISEASGFEEEVQVLSRFRHPNLVILMGFSRDGGRCALVYELLEGGDCANRLAKSRAREYEFNAKQRISVLLDCAMGLSHMHNSKPKAFHRDIKTANILLDKNGGAKMADFGLSCVSKESNAKKVKHVSGTIGYACPHYIRFGVVNEAAEIYSFGMVILEILTARPPALQGQNPGEFKYLLDDIADNKDNVIRMLDLTASWPSYIANMLCNWAFKCSLCPPERRTNFIDTVSFLRSLLEKIETMDYFPEAEGLQLEYQVGARVVARWKDTLIEFKGAISKVNPNSTCTIQYDDAEVEQDVPFARIKVVERAQKPRRLLQSPSPSLESAPSLLPTGPSLPTSSDAAVEPRQLRPKRDTVIDAPNFGVFPGESQSAPSRTPSPCDSRRSPYSMAGKPPHWTCRLRCDHPDPSIILWVETQLPVGRMSHPLGLWEELLSESVDRSTVSREHFEVYAGPDAFVLRSRSQNGTLLNNELIRGKAERNLYHSDVIALTSKPDGTCPFLSFIFETRAECDRLAGHGHLRNTPREDTRSDPDGSIVSGRWIVAANDRSNRDMDLFCLEVHGDPSAVRTQIDASQRQISFTADSTANKMPTLRIGEFQSRFWDKVLIKPWRTSISSAHFEIKPKRLTNPMLKEPARWSYMLKVIEPITLNRSLELGIGEEQRLTSGDTLTFPRCETGALVHLTFIDFTYIPPKPTPSPTARQENLAQELDSQLTVKKIRESMLELTPRELPDMGLLDDDVGRETDVSLTTENTEALRPPVHIERADDPFII